jgi:hypothetical protein
MPPRVKVTEVARRRCLTPSVVFTWRRLAREWRLGNARPVFMPVEITLALAARAGALHPLLFSWLHQVSYLGACYALASSWIDSMASTSNGRLCK